MPGVFIEASLAAVPVVATDVPGARDVIDEGGTGRVVPVDDLAALTDAVAQLLEDADLRTAMGRAARARCEQLFSLERSTSVFLAELAALQRRRSARSARPRPQRQRGPDGAGEQAGHQKDGDHR
jgi:glycosyltransferase involved in cell wall biosynthesis